jgi:PBSX family phage terminase large subunit
MQTTKIFDANLHAYQNKTRYIVNQGGARAGKTFAILQVLLIVAFYSKKPLIISVVSQSIPHLKLGAIRDFKYICYSLKIPFEENFNKTELKFEINNCIIEFFSTDNLGKVHGPARDILFINECNNIPFEVFEQLEIRTRGRIFLDYNPVSRFWVHTDILSNPNYNATLIKSTYLDNLQNLAPEIVQSIENKKDKKNWWQIYGLGEVGYSEDLLFAEGNLRYFESFPENFQHLQKICYIDTADVGKDYFCAVFGAVAGSDVYIFDVIYNQQPLSVNEPYSIEKLNKYDVDYLIVETNREGAYFLQNLKKKVKAKLQPIFNTTNKESRILARGAFICDNFIFAQNRKNSPEYINYFNHLVSYSITQKNEHDDAPDASAGLAKFCTNILKI